MDPGGVLGPPPRSIPNLKGKYSSQIWSIYYNKIEIIILSLCSKLKFTINWEKIQNIKFIRYNTISLPKKKKKSKSKSKFGETNNVLR